MADRMVSYCDTGDVFCDGGLNRTVHRQYVTNYGTNATDFIVAKASASSSGGNGGPGGSGATGDGSTPTPTPSNSDVPGAGVLLRSGYVSVLVWAAGASVLLLAL